jgi:hypothetical protein
VAREDNLKPFSKENQPANRGRPKGSPNRSTLLKKWLSAKMEITNPITRLKEKGKVEDEVILALVNKARKGDVPAIREILDTMYGKTVEKHEISGEGGGPIPITIIEPIKPENA